MNDRSRKASRCDMAIQIIFAARTEISLEGPELLKLEFVRPGVCVTCTTGVLWLTQQDDSQDYILKAGQSFTLSQRGSVLVQGLPCGKALIQLASAPLPFSNGAVLREAC